jgi:hypothetical protein
MWMPSRKAGIRIGHSSVPTQQRLKELFDYHHDGILIARKSHGQRIAGEPVGRYEDADRYATTSVDSKTQRIHRLIWIWHNGPIPEDRVIDHIDRDRRNNRITNLRLATSSENNRNRVYKNSLGGGIRIIRGRYSVIFWISGGTHDTLEQALAAKAKLLMRYNRESP